MDTEKKRPVELRLDDEPDCYEIEGKQFKSVARATREHSDFVADEDWDIGEEAREVGTKAREGIIEAVEYPGGKVPDQLRPAVALIRKIMDGEHLIANQVVTSGGLATRVDLLGQSSIGDWHLLLFAASTSNPLTDFCYKTSYNGMPTKHDHYRMRAAFAKRILEKRMRVRISTMNVIQLDAGNGGAAYMEESGSILVGASSDPSIDGYVDQILTSNPEPAEVEKLPEVEEHEDRDEVDIYAPLSFDYEDDGELTAEQEELLGEKGFGGVPALAPFATSLRQQIEKGDKSLIPLYLSTRRSIMELRGGEDLYALKAKESDDECKSDANFMHPELNLRLPDEPSEIENQSTKSEEQELDGIAAKGGKVLAAHLSRLHSEIEAGDVRLVPQYLCARRRMKELLHGEDLFIPHEEACYACKGFTENREKLEEAMGQSQIEELDRACKRGVDYLIQAVKALRERIWEKKFDRIPQYIRARQELMDHYTATGDTAHPVE